MWHDGQLTSLPGESLLRPDSQFRNTTRLFRGKFTMCATECLAKPEMQAGMASLLGTVCGALLRFKPCLQAQQVGLVQATRALCIDCHTPSFPSAPTLDPRLFTQIVQRDKLFQGNRGFLALAELVLGWLLVRHAGVALARREANPVDRAFYDGKIASARFFCEEVLPGLGLARRLVENGSLGLMQVPEDAFDRAVDAAVAPELEQESA